MGDLPVGHRNSTASGPVSINIGSGQPQHLTTIVANRHWHMYASLQNWVRMMFHNTVAVADAVGLSDVDADQEIVLLPKVVKWNSVKTYLELSYCYWAHGNMFIKMPAGVVGADRKTCWYGHCPGLRHQGCEDGLIKLYLTFYYK